ncbi:hypothetical protein ACIGHN_27535 [Acidovorax sp. NPDC077693]|uniref:hypothetical protein n=1 Tax=unclassified Acidovorax TaxID=2684926 RepID=UPI0037C51E8D
MLLYDFQQKEIVSDVSDYADELVLKLSMARASIHQEIGHLRVFVGYLSSRGLGVNDCSNKLIADFRDFFFSKIPSGTSANVVTADRARITINAKLVRIYDWLKWLQENGRAAENLIGAKGCRVESHLFGSSLSYLSPRNSELRSFDRYPLLLDVRTRNKRGGFPKYVPTEDTVDALHEYFLESDKSLHIKYRNILMIDIAAYTGFRRGSIQSLEIDQFIGKSFEITDRDTVLLRPARQKRSYGDYFEIPIDLHQNVTGFIKNHRAQHLIRKNVPESRTKGAVFISERSCQPLDDRSITAIVSEALRACGAPKGVAIHSFRAKFLIKSTELEYEDRKNLGLDTSSESVSRSVATKAGHRSTRSIKPYTEGNEASKLVKHHNNQARRAKETLAENTRLRARLKELEELIENSKKSQ